MTVENTKTGKYNPSKKPSTILDLSTYIDNYMDFTLKFIHVYIQYIMLSSFF